jgi:hypothetical protein
MTYLLPNKPCTYREAQFINEFTNVGLSSDKIDVYRKEHNIQEGEFAKKPLPGVAIITKFVGTFMSSGEEELIAIGPATIEAYFSFLLIVGKEFIIYDEIIESTEIQKLKDYSRMLTSYATGELDKYGVAINFSSVDNEIDFEFDKLSVKKGQEQNEHFENEEERQGECLQELLSQLNALVGLESVKRDVTSMIRCI